MKPLAFDAAEVATLEFRTVWQSRQRPIVEPHDLANLHRRLAPGVAMPQAIAVVVVVDEPPVSFWVHKEVASARAEHGRRTLYDRRVPTFGHRLAVISQERPFGF